MGPVALLSAPARKSGVARWLATRRRVSWLPVDFLHPASCLALATEVGATCFFRRFATPGVFLKFRISGTPAPSWEWFSSSTQSRPQTAVQFYPVSSADQVRLIRGVRLALQTAHWWSALHSDVDPSRHFHCHLYFGAHSDLSWYGSLEICASRPKILESD